MDLERREVLRAFTPLRVIRGLLAGRGANMFYLYRLLDERLQPLDPDIPLIFGSGVLTGIEMATAMGAIAIGVEDRFGVLEPGMNIIEMPFQ